MEKDYLAEYVGKYCRHWLTGNAIMDLDPLSKLNILLVFGLSSFIVRDYRYGFTLCGIYFVLAFLCGKLKAFSAVFLRIMLLVSLFVVVVRQLTIEGEIIIFSLMGWQWTLEALKNGLDMSSVLLGFSGAVVLFYVLTEMRDLMYSLEMKGVSHTVSYVMLSSFQTITDLGERAKTILDSQKSRGIETEGGIFSRVRAFIPIMGPLVLGALSSAEEKYIAMDARAFSVNRKHTFLRELRPVPGWERGIVVVVNVSFAILCLFKIYTIFFRRFF